MVFEPFGQDVGQVLAIVGQQGHCFFDAEAVVLDDDEDEQLQQRLGSPGVASRIDFADVDLNCITKWVPSSRPLS